MALDPSAGCPLELLLETLKNRLSKAQYNTWFSKLRKQSESDGRITVSVINSVVRDWIESRYSKEINGAKAELGLQDLEFRFVSDPAAFEDDDVSVAPPEERKRRRVEPVAREIIPFFEEYNFENFIVGPSNQFAHAASLRVAENPGRDYNPLFLHGSVGVGKTHLLQAAGLRIGKECPEKRMLYLSCEAFTNHFIDALEHGTVQSFRNKFRMVDVLLIDDVHFLSNKERTQEEFFHTFNAIHSAGGQIVMTSDSPPKEIPALQERLVSRFKWGMVAEIAQPSYEERIAILQKKAHIRNLQVDEEVLRYLARSIEANTRELEGAVTKIAGLATIQKQRIDLPLVQNALKDILPERRQLLVEDIQNAVSKRFNVRLADLQSKKRSRSIVVPRQIGMYLSRLLTDHSLEEIGGFFGGRDHSTVLHADQQIRIRKDKDDELSRTLDTLQGELRGLQSRRTSR